MATDGPGKAPGHSTRFYAALIIAAALAIVGLKAAAYLLTGSVGLLSDAAESSANLIAAVGAFWALSAAARPPTRSTPSATPRTSSSPAPWRGLWPGRGGVHRGDRSRPTFRPPTALE